MNTTPMSPDEAGRSHVHFDRLLSAAASLSPLPTAVVAPEKPDALQGALLGRDHGLIDPIFVGCSKKIAKAAEALNADLSGIEIIDNADHQSAAHQAVALVGENRAGAVMKGHLHSDQLLRAVLRKDGGLRTSRRLSHDFVLDIPGHDRLLHITDAAINIAPDLECKASICQNAIDLARALGVETPRVAALSGAETVNAAMPSSLEAAMLAKMADRGQITGGFVDGPFAMDNAINAEAARIKGITGPVAGQADILLVPELETGNMLAKGLTFLGGALTAGIVLGAQVPIIFTSRADDDAARLASCAVAVLYRANMP